MQHVIFGILKNFIGSWNFDRSISMPALYIKGNATFKKESKAILSYSEYGTYTMDAIQYDFFQKRLFTYDNNSFYIYKTDHSLLHKFELKNHNTSYPITLIHTHLCGSDTYKCTLIIKTEKCFEMHYNINGKNKNYEIITLYTKR